MPVHNVRKPKAVKSKAAKPKTRAKWAAEIRAAHERFVDDFFKIGRMLIAAKRALLHGEFEKMIERELPFTASTAQRLMKIARNPRIGKAARARLLPSAWSALYELSQLSDAAFDEGLRSGAINPKTTREQARTVRFDVTYEDKHFKVPVYDVHRDPPKKVRPIYKKPADDYDPPPMRLVASAQPEPLDLPPPDDASLALSEIERLVSDLAMAVERGDVRADQVFKARVRAVADQLTLIADDDPAALN